MILSLAKNLIVPQPTTNGGGGYVPISIGNISYSTEVFSGGSKTRSFAVTLTTNAAVYLFVNLNGGYDAVTATWAGEAMTKQAQYSQTGFFSDIVVFEKLNPIVGVNNFVISFGAAYNDELNIYILECENTIGFIQAATADSTASPVQATFASPITQGSLIIAGAVGLDDLVSGQEIELPAGTYNGYDSGKYTSPGFFPGKIVFHNAPDVAAGAFTGETNHTSTGLNKNSGIVMVEIGRVV